MGLQGPDVEESWESFVLSGRMVKGGFGTETEGETRVVWGLISGFFAGMVLGTGG